MGGGLLRDVSFSDQTYCTSNDSYKTNVFGEIWAMPWVMTSRMHTVNLAISVKPNNLEKKWTLGNVIIFDDSRCNIILYSRTCTILSISKCNR